MMHTSLSAFKSSLVKIRQYVDDLEKKNDIIDKAIALPCASQEIKDDIADLQTKRNSEKEFDYTVVIVTLYGQYETFIEKSIREYVKELQHGGYPFSQLPEKIKGGYFSKGIGLHGKLEWEKYKHLDERIIAKSIHEALNQDIQNILPEAFYTNGGNYKVDVLAGCLGDLGIENAKQFLCQYPSLQSYYQGKYGPGVNVNEKDTEVLYGIVDEVVETRNKIAHTGKVDEIKDKTYVVEMIEFFENFAESMTMLMQDALCEIKWNNSTSVAFQPVNVFKGPSVAGFKGVEFEVHQNQDCLCCYPAGHYPKYNETTILGIEESGNSYINYHLYPDNTNGVGLKMGIDVSQGCKFKFL